jgi:3-deoxy-D-manno-octulosonic-acid transferase
MVSLYNIGVRLYYWLVLVASIFNNKAKLWIKGRRHQHIQPLKSSIWFHYASLGEFEQGRPVMEKLRALYSRQTIVVTFFSPSGYEVRKNTTHADVVYYLPLDTAANARDFIDSIKPVMAVFTKYEYWYHYFNQLHKQHIPLYIISGIFRQGQPFFKWYGGLHRAMLKMVTWFFVQDINSKHLLQSRGISNVAISGDTRFDRVWANAQQPRPQRDINDFKSGQKLFIAGSTWPDDEKLVATLVKDHPDWKFIIAPHEIGADRINSLMNLLPKDITARYTKLDELSGHISYQGVLVIDNIGILSSLYMYADVAYIGGGFGVGIHNTLEAAAFGVPVIFGPNYHKFNEAVDLVEKKAAYTIKDKKELQQIATTLMDDNAARKAAGTKARAYVKEHVGATDAVVNYVLDKHPQ